MKTETNVKIVNSIEKEKLTMSDINIIIIKKTLFIFGSNVHTRSQNQFLVCFMQNSIYKSIKSLVVQKIQGVHLVMCYEINGSLPRQF